MSINGDYCDVMVDNNCVYNLKDEVNHLWFGVNMHREDRDARRKAAKDIAHAINCHDELVEALGVCMDYLEAGGQDMSVTDAIAAYNKAKGEAK